MSLPASIKPLCKLLNALDSGECHFIQLSYAECEQWWHEFTEQVDARTVRTQKLHSDKGKKCGFYNQSTTDLDKENDESG